MGIGPQEFRHRGLFHDNYFIRFVRRTSVMCERGDTNCWKNTKQGQKHEERAFQSVRPELESFAGAALLAYRSKLLVSTSRIMTATISLRLLLVSPELAIPQNLAIAKHDLIETADRVAGFCRVYVNSDDVAGLKRIPGPAQKTGCRRAPRFAGPVRDVAPVVFHVEHDNVMGIGPQEFRHRGVF